MPIVQHHIEIRNFGEPPWQMPKDIALVFLFGRPGSGKSTVYDLLRRKLKDKQIGKRIVKIDDYPRLLELTERDIEHKRHRHSPEGGFDIIDHTALDEVLQEINVDVRKYRTSDTLVFVEFARKSYADALENFDQDILKNCIIIYVDCPFDICWKRNVNRALKGEGKGHIVPRNNMERLYQTDDFSEMLKKVSMPTIKIDNTTNDLRYLELMVYKVAETLFPSDFT